MPDVQRIGPGHPGYSSLVYQARYGNHLRYAGKVWKRTRDNEGIVFVEVGATTPGGFEDSYDVQSFPQGRPAPAEAPAADAEGESETVDATPAARELAAENGVDLSEIGVENDRVRKADVVAFIEAREAEAEAEVEEGEEEE